MSYCYWCDNPAPEEHAFCSEGCRDQACKAGLCCQVCHGTGFNPKRWDPREDGECPACNGTGLVEMP